nr:hypothetical protein CFP56_58515 [Quercus suber]
MALDFPRQISFVRSTMKLIPPSQIKVSSKAAMFLARDTQSPVNRSASKMGWGCRQSWAEDVQACFDCQGHTQSCNFLL